MTPAAGLDFRVLKSRAPIERVLEARGLLKAMRQHGDNLIGPCPIHRGDSTTAFVVTRSKNLWHCFTRCRGVGDVVDLVRRLNEIDHRSTALYLASLAGMVSNPDHRGGDSLSTIHGASETRPRCDFPRQQGHPREHRPLPRGRALPRIPRMALLHHGSEH